MIVKSSLVIWCLNLQLKFQTPIVFISQGLSIRQLSLSCFLHTEIVIVHAEILLSSIVAVELVLLPSESWNVLVSETYSFVLLWPQSCTCYWALVHQFKSDLLILASEGVPLKCATSNLEILLLYYLQYCGLGIG